MLLGRTELVGNSPIRPFVWVRYVHGAVVFFSRTSTQGAPYAFRPGRAYPHPDWTGQLTVPNTHDVGVVVLDNPVLDIVPAEIAPLGFIDNLLTKRGTKSLRMIAVGYGVTERSNAATEEHLKSGHSQVGK